MTTAILPKAVGFVVAIAKVIAKLTVVELSH